MIEDIFTRRGKSIPTKMPLSEEIRKSIFQLIFALCIIIIMIIIIYLMNSGGIGQKGNLIKQYDIERNMLYEESRKLIAEIIKAQSTDQVASNPLLKKMVKATPENMIYLNKP